MKEIIQQLLSDALTMALPEPVQRDCRIPEIPGKTHAVIGMRRTGKTFFLFQRMHHYLQQGIERSRLVYFNFEDERLLGLTVQDLHWIPDEYFALYPHNRNAKVFFFFDEIQLIGNWEIFVRRLMDAENVQVYISGSSAKMLSREMATAMRGRSVETIVYPYSFKEYLRSQRIACPSSKEVFGKNTRSLLVNRLRQFLSEGGFPEAQGLADRDHRLLLQGYVNTVLFRDIVDRFSVKNITALKKLIRHLIINSGSPFTVNKYYRQLKTQGIKIAKTTLHEYLDHLNDVFLVHPMSLHAKSERKRLVNPIKPYVIDTGLVAAFCIPRQMDVGNLLENCIFVELCRSGAEVSYLKTPSGHEVDFFVETIDGRRQAIQVCADLSQQATRERECRSLREVNAHHPDNELYIITLDEAHEIDIGDAAIHVVPAWKWLLGV